ncbi:MAG: ChrB [Massilia sp.]|nr:ChrB [Massilia sp.]
MMASYDQWLLLILSLPSSSATGRMRIWRALKALGCAALRDGVYLLPHSDAGQKQLYELAEETRREGGNAWLVAMQPLAGDHSAIYRALFERVEEHGQFMKTLTAARPTLAALAPQELNRLLRKLRRDYDALVATDYFPNDVSAQSETAWIDFVDVAQALLSPGEPRAIAAEIAPRDRTQYQGRIWATRRRLWVDRVASAWLIRRFIDGDARFLWLETPEDCPSDALGFDFDRAAFTHIGERVTFEVLLASFDLEHDVGLARLGAMVHALDVGGAFVPEAAGFEAMLAGARQHGDDDQLLTSMSAILDALYAHFSSAPAAPASP